MMATDRKENLTNQKMMVIDAVTNQHNTDGFGIKYKLPENMVLTSSKLTVIGDFSVNITSIRHHLTEDLFASFLNTIITLANENGQLSSQTIYSYIHSFNRYIQYSREISITSLSILLDRCHRHSIGYSEFKQVKMLLIKWHSLNYPGISDDIIDFISKVKSPSPRRPAGSKVRSDDPTEGWYTNAEYDSLVQAIWRAYESGSDGLWKTTILLLSAQFGRRPVQISHLKIGDLKIIKTSNNISEKHIEFPGAKDRTTNGFRQSKKEVHPISDELFKLCQDQAADSILLFESHFKYKLSTTETLLLPLFPSRSKKSFENNLDNAKHLHKSNDSFLSSPLLHVKSGVISSIIQEGPSGQNIISERTSQPLLQNSYRFRYTRARQLARSGVPRGMLQHWLGHETKFSVDAYYDDPAERARELNNLIAPLLAPLAQAFQGELRDNEANAIRGNDPTSRIEVDGREDLGVGTCGEHGFCSASVPIPCYRCTKFQPWLHGPHHEVLSRLLERQRQENEIPRPHMGRRLLVPVQLEKDIKAVQEVIALCEARQAIVKEQK
jgi:integrase